MGKKNRKAKLAATEVDGGMPRHVRRETLEIVSSLLEMCSVPFGTRSTEWADYLDVYKLVEKLRKKQQSYCVHFSARDEHIPAFVQWLTDNGVDISSVTIEQFVGSGYGLKAARDVEEAELFLSIPRQLLMTTETALASVLGPLIKEDKILQSMSNVAMALHVLCELSCPESFWLPYLRILPDVYTTPLYFSPDEVQLLKGSPLLSEVLNQYRNITRQYAYFFRLFQGHASADKLPIRNFCFDDYRWAVSTVMTRQNHIPSLSSDEADTALIPLWDMCNHASGWVTTNYSDKNNCCECFAMHRFAQGEQIFIFYGPRSNAELFLHSGFVYDDNKHDRMSIRMGISKNDQLYAMKTEVLAHTPVSMNQPFYLHCNPDQPVDSELLAYLRVFAMDHDTLLLYLMGDSSAVRRQDLSDFSRPVSKENETKAWAFLETRAELLLKAYCTTVQDDMELLSMSDLSLHASLAVRLRLAEKNILLGVIKYAAEQKVKAQYVSDLSTSGSGETDFTNMSNTCDKVDISPVNNVDIPEATSSQEEMFMHK